jgi:SAM-dependent methyltransferase
MRSGTVRAEAASGDSREHSMSSPAELPLRLRCPRCSANLSSLACAKCGMEMRQSGGIVHALRPERVAHYARFVADYEHIRAAEGRGSDHAEFFLGLPYRDVSGRNKDQWRIRSRSYQYLLDQVLRPALPIGARVLDLGAGNCWMCHRLARAGFSVVGVDLLTNPYDGLGAAGHYLKHLPQLFPRFQAELEHLPFQEKQFDAVVFNASFHYAEDAKAALGEALRCAKNDGLVVISDTPWYSSEESGHRMVEERQQRFLRRYGTASSSLDSIEFVTNDRLRVLEWRLGIEWKVCFPKYGVRWAMRPCWAILRNRREPAQFRIFVAQRKQA